MKEVRNGGCTRTLQQTQVAYKAVQYGQGLCSRPHTHSLQSNALAYLNSAQLRQNSHGHSTTAATIKTSPSNLCTDTV